MTVLAPLFFAACVVGRAAAQQAITPSTAFTDLTPISASSSEYTSAGQYIHRGEAEFKRNQITASCGDFDTAVVLNGRAAGLWQRGLSLFYCERLQDGLEQFQGDVASNPNDTEETIWHFLCNARLKAAVPGVTPVQAVAAARLQLLPIPQHENRPVMSVAMSVYAGTGTAAELDAAGGVDSSSNAYFYAHLYLGLWYEANGQTELARSAIVAAATSSYGSAVDGADYMWHLARVHSRRRGWDVPAGGGGASGDGMGCSGTEAVNAACGIREGSAAGIPLTCTEQCGGSFLPWFAACPEANAWLEGGLAEFGLLCQQGGGGGGGH